MIYHFAHPSAQSSAQPVEGLAAVPGINPYQQRGIPAAFRMPDDGSKTDDKEDEDKQYQEMEEYEALPPGTPEMFRLIMGPNFREMLDFFLTPGHQDILQIRASIREHKALSDKDLYRPEIMNNDYLDQIRHKLYLVTFEFYHSPNGKSFIAIA